MKTKAERSLMCITGRMLRERRETLGYDQIEMCEILGTSQGTLSKWESGFQSIPLHILLKYDVIHLHKT